MGPEKRMRWGAPVSDPEKATLVRYLTDHFK